MKGGPLLLLGAALGTATYVLAQRYAVVWPWEIFKWSNATLLVSSAVVGVGWLGFGALSVGWLNRRRQLGPGR